jgi:two-component system sensor histidine kinase HydH
MDHKLLIRVTAPAVLIGLILFGACVAGAIYIKRLQKNLANVVTQNVASLQAAQELEISIRQLRFHNLLYLIKPAPDRLERIEQDQQLILAALAEARAASVTDEEQACIREIDSGCAQYQMELASLRANPEPRMTPTEAELVNAAHPIHGLTDQCEQLLRLNQRAMVQTSEESQRVAWQANLAMILLGLGGPISGIVLGYGVARGLSRSIYRLSVRVQDAAQRLERDIASVNLVADGNLQRLDSQLQQIVGGVEDVVDKLQRQEREMLRAEQMSAVGQLAAGVAHEVRNPLAGIKLLIDSALASKNAKPLNMEDLHVIQHEVTRLEQTVQAFLDFARPPSPKLCRCDLREVVSQAADLVRARARQLNVQIDIRAPEAPVDASVDRGQICTVLVNLLLNSLDAMPQGGRIEIDLEEGPDNRRIRVQDSGTGIPPDILPRLFTPFATSKPTGTGLGLSISRRVVEEHRGTINAFNRAPNGACFEVSLPSGPAESTDAKVAAGR